jgi:exo-beta-1,3-glucanase (GH17 family)
MWTQRNRTWLYRMLLWMFLLVLSSTHLQHFDFVSLAQEASETTGTDPIPLNHGEWQFFGDYRMDLSCFGASGDEGFLLGADSSCSPSLGSATATTMLSVPPIEGSALLIVRIDCASSQGCSNAINAALAGQVSLSIDGQLMWTASCDATGLCDSLALGTSPTVAFTSLGASNHLIALNVSQNLSWAIRRLEIELFPMPSLIRGIAYSPFRDCQNPHFGPYPSLGEIYQDMAQLKNMGNAIRTYSSLGVQGQIPQIANQFGLRVSAGASLGPDLQKNEAEIEAVIALSRVVPLESIIVGNEVLLRGDLSEEQLIAYIERVKAEVTVPVTSAETAHDLLGHPNLMNALDYYLVHIYAFWSTVPIEDAAQFVVNEYRRVESQAGDKRVIIGETGWPSAGPANGPSIPNPENQRRFLREFLTLAHLEKIEFYYFSGFNELWKTEGGVGPFWGFMDAERVNLYDLQSVLIPLDASPSGSASSTLLEPAATASPSPQALDSSLVFPVYTNYALIAHEDHVSNHFAPSGFMGDYHALRFDDCYRLGAAWDNRGIAIGYEPSAADPGGWAGIYWQQPENNWATVANAGYNLRAYSHLRFLARSDVVGAQAQFFIGGVTDGPYPSSIATPVYPQGADQFGFVTLSNQWQEFHIDLSGVNLSYVIDGFAVLLDRQHTPYPVTIYLDNIIFDTAPAPETSTTPSPSSSSLRIVDGNVLLRGYHLGLDSSEHRYDWLSQVDGALRLDYPANQEWGLVYVTIDQPTGDGTIDLSSYSALVLDLRGERGDERVSIGIQDHQGGETKLPLQLSAEWESYPLLLSRFTGVDLTAVRIPLELVFEDGIGAETIYVRNIRFLANPVEQE